MAKVKTKAKWEGRGEGVKNRLVVIIVDDLRCA